ncbi:MAG: hypothetical protein V7703_21950, partial [Hyphomicrobiales bacterium]
ANASDVIEPIAAADTPPPAKAKPPAALKQPLIKPVAAKAAPKSPPTALAADGKILASPKAKQEAKRRGISLAALVRQGGAQPFHYADIVQAEMHNSSASSGNSTVSARISRKALTAFREWLEKELGSPLDTSNILAGFASGALRSCGAVSVDEPLQCDIKPTSQTDEQISIVDADYTGLMTPNISATDTDGKLIIYDLTNTRLTGFSPPLQPDQIAIVLTVASKKKLELHCHYNASELSTDEALAFTSDLAGRLSEPLRNLL